MSFSSESDNENNSKHTVPKRVFIVPYRNRPQHKFFFCKYMVDFILEDMEDYEVYFSNQCDRRTFNRGANKNIGFLAIKEKYPDDYKDITFIFNDVDTIPFNKIFDYNTTPGVVKHFYGYEYALGGIVVIKGGDFERLNGFPCYWGWGMEDNVLQKRCKSHNIRIDRSVFYKIGSPEILQLFDGISRIISKKDPWRMDKDNGADGLRTIRNLKYTIDDKSLNPNDNFFAVHHPNIFFINTVDFSTHISFEEDNYYNYDLREPKRKIVNPDKLRQTKDTFVTTHNWSNIPYYPTTLDRKEQHIKQMQAQGKAVPQNLIDDYKNMKAKEISNDAFNSFMTASNNNNNTPRQPHAYPYAPPHAYPYAPPQPPSHRANTNKHVTNSAVHRPVVPNQLINYYVAPRIGKMRLGRRL